MSHKRTTNDSVQKNRCITRLPIILQPSLTQSHNYKDSDKTSTTSVFQKNNYNADFIKRNIYWPSKADEMKRNPTTVTAVPYVYYTWHWDMHIWCSMPLSNIFITFRMRRDREQKNTQNVSTCIVTFGFCHWYHYFWKTQLFNMYFVFDFGKLAWCLCAIF